GKGRDGLQLGPLSALADTTGTDLLFSGFQCTAGDITLISARALNEPCGCTPGTPVSLTVEFTLKNSATSARSCIVLHLCPATYTVNGQTFTFDPDDIVLPGVIQDQETKTYQAVIQ